VFVALDIQHAMRMRHMFSDYHSSTYNQQYATLYNILYCCQ
jgi:hypothetical protein